MHPELYLVLYTQQQWERDTERERRRLQHERAAAPLPRRQLRDRLPHLHLRRHHRAALPAPGGALHA